MDERKVGLAIRKSKIEIKTKNISINVIIYFKRIII